MKKEKRVGYIALEEQEIKDGAEFWFVSDGGTEITTVFQTKKETKEYHKRILSTHRPDANMYEVIIRKVEA